MSAHYRHPVSGQIHKASSDETRRFLESRGYQPHQTPDDAAELKGTALDDALDDAGLLTTGTADEKRARLAAHLAQPPAGGDFDTPPTQGTPDPSQTDNA